MKIAEYLANFVLVSLESREFQIFFLTNYFVFEFWHNFVIDSWYSMNWKRIHEYRLISKWNSGVFEVSEDLLLLLLLDI